MAKVNLYLTLDSLYDVRLPVLDELVSKIEMVQVMKKYVHRDNDAFWEDVPSLTKEHWDSAWKARNFIHLATALETDALTYFHHTLKPLTDVIQSRPDMTESILVRVNVYPYPMDEHMMAGVASNIVSGIPGDVEVDFVRVPKLPTVQELVNYEVVMLHDISQWIMDCEGGGLEGAALNTVLIAPAIFHLTERSRVEARISLTPEELLDVRDIPCSFLLVQLLGGRVLFKPTGAGVFRAQTTLVPEAYQVDPTA